VRLFGVASLGLAALACAGDQDVTPVVSRLNTLSIHVRSHAIHDSLHALLAEKLQLPRTYELVTIGERRYVAVWAGNLALEPCGPYPADSYLDTDFEAMFYGLTFEPGTTAEASAAALDTRGIPHAEPTGSVRIDDEDLRAPNVYVGIGESSTPEQLARFQSELDARGGGPLGLRHVGEIRIGYTDERSLGKWLSFLTPAEHRGEHALRLGDGPVLRFLPNATKQVLGITLEVRSLAEAKAFLRESGLLGTTVDGGVELDRARTHGIGIVLEE
jgi:hypothetical protein